MIYWTILLLTVGALSLYKGADLVVDNSSTLAARFGISTIVVGLSIVTFGTVLPELTIAVITSFNKANDVVLGNALGTTVFSLGMILGLAALINPIAIKRSILRHEFPWLIMYSVLIYFLAWDLLISRGDAVILILLGFVFLWYSVRQSHKQILEEVGKRRLEERVERAQKNRRNYFFVFLGAVLIVIGAKLFIDSALFLAEAAGVSQLLVGILIVAIGTSLPELATTVTAAARKQAAVGVGNVIGSSALNVFFILGVASLIHPISVHRDMLYFDFPMVIFFTILISVLFRSSLRLSRVEGGLLVAGYILYFVYSIKFWG